MSEVATTFLDISKILANVGENSSNIYKQRVLEANGHIKLLRDVLQFIYNPYFKTGISDAKLDRAPVYMDYPVPETAEGIMEFLKNHPTGDLETCGICKTWLKKLKTPEEQWLGRGLITQHLIIGVSVTTLNKVFGKEFISKISCMLGTPIDKIPESRQKWPYIVTEKLDGVRRIMLKQNGRVRLFSRNGHEDEGLVDIIKEAEQLPDNYMYDGELLAIGTFTDSIAQRQATNSIANMKGERHGLTFNIFDMVPIGDFLCQTSTASSFERKKTLAMTLGDTTGSLLVDEPQVFAAMASAHGEENPFSVIKPVPILAVATCMEDIEPVVSALWSAGKEGVMLNAWDAGYESKRTKTLVKMKKTETFVLRVEGFIEGSGRLEGSLGSLLTVYKDCMLQVGSGFTDAERWEIWAHQDKYDGLLFEVESFGESTNRQGLVSLNCPIFKRFIKGV